MCWTTRRSSTDCSRSSQPRNRVDDFAASLSEQAKSGDLSLLTVGHVMSCGLKVLTTDLATAGIETARRACGGHGYLLSSGLPVLLPMLI